MLVYTSDRSQERMFRWPVFSPHQESLRPSTAWNRETPCDVMSFSPGAGDAGNTNQERPLDWKALKDYCFLTGSLLLEQRGKFGHNFISSRAAVAKSMRLTWLLGWGFWGECYWGAEDSPLLLPPLLILFAADAQSSYWLFWSVPSPHLKPE